MHLISLWCNMKTGLSWKMLIPAVKYCTANNLKISVSIIFFSEMLVTLKALNHLELLLFISAGKSKLKYYCQEKDI